MGPKNRFNLTYFLIVLGSIFIVQNYLQTSVTKSVPFSEFKTLLRDGKIKEVIISDSKYKGILQNTQKKNNKKIVIANRIDPDVAKQLDQYNVKYWKIIESTFLRDILSWVLPVLIFFGFWMFLSKKFMSQSGGSFMSIGKSKAKVYVEKDIKVSFDDVAGVDEAKDELEEIINFLKNPSSYGRLGAKMPRGVLLVGPPGTGKTLLAKAVAGEAQVPFFSISGSEFVEMFVGVGAARVRDLFEQARKHAPCIIFIDELDALGKARGVGNLGGGHDEKEQTLNQLLVELDGFDTTLGVVLLAATNRPEILDPALLRAGRFDRQVLVDKPDKSGRLEILKVHAKSIKIAPKLQLDEIAALTTGFTGADLANLLNEAALSATRNNRENVTLEDFNIAIERIVAGLEKKSRVLNSNERKIVAFHEMGHAFTAATLSNSEKVHKVSIVPRGVGALGYTIQRPTEDRYLMSLEELENKMSILLGGRASEKLFFNSISTGSSDDISKVTEIARGIVTRYGMIPELGHVVYNNSSQNFMGKNPYVEVNEKNFSEETIKCIDNNVKEIVNRSFDKAYEILELNRELLEQASNDLLEKETLNEPELLTYFSKLKQV